MERKMINSDASKDEIFTSIHRKSHKGFFTINKIDDAMAHIKLIGDMTDYFKKEDVKWIEMKLSFVPVLPVNTISYVNKVNDNFVCHIEDFEKFYFANIDKFVQYEMIVGADINNNDGDGWIVVGDNTSKGKKRKFTNIKTELLTLVGDWNNIDTCE
jgi:hypothetical protein